MNSKNYYTSLLIDVTVHFLVINQEKQMCTTMETFYIGVHSNFVSDGQKSSQNRSAAQTSIRN